MNRNHKALIIVLAFISLSFSSFAFSARLLTFPDSPNRAMFVGEIVKGDFEKIEDFLRNVKALPITFQLLSEGGDVDEAIKIGRLFRQLSIMTEASGFCNSACFLIWVGSPVRLESNLSSFALHRPFFDSNYYKDLSIDEARNEYRQLEDKFRDYLLQMGVGLEFVNRIMSFSSQDSLPQSSNEIGINVGFRDTYVDELLIAKCEALPRDEERDIELILLFEKDQRTLTKSEPDLDQETRSIIQSRFSRLEPEYSKLSPGYVSYLKIKNNGISDCEMEFFMTTQLSALKSAGYLPDRAGF